MDATGKKRQGQHRDRDRALIRILDSKQSDQISVAHVGSRADVALQLQVQVGVFRCNLEGPNDMRAEARVDGVMDFQQFAPKSGPLIDDVDKRPITLCVVGPRISGAYKHPI